MASDSEVFDSTLINHTLLQKCSQFHEVTTKCKFVLCVLDIEIHLASWSCQCFFTFVSLMSPILGPLCWVHLCEPPAGHQSRPAVRPLYPWTDLMRPSSLLSPVSAISFSVCIPASSSCAISCLHYSWPQFGHQSLSRTSPQLVLTRPLQLCGWCASAPIICLLKPSHTWWGNSTHHSHLSTLSPALTRSSSLSV